jgi:diguanylate cyclase (GGDEF)-like protein/PAS domain S-box-containing protein
MAKKKSAKGSSTEAEECEASIAGEGYLEGYPGAALIVAADGSVIRFNAEGAGLGALLAHQAIPEIVKLVKTAASTKAVASESVTLESSKGEIALQVTVSPMAADRLLMLARDLTMERNLRTALVDSQQRYKDLVEISSDFSWEVSTDGKFIFVSPKGAFGYSAEELVDTPAVDLAADPDEFSTVPFVSQRPLDDVELWMTCKDGTTACLVVSCVPLFEDVDGVQVWSGTRGVCRDVTDEREGEAALGRARHREQILNYIISTIRDELEPLNMLSAAAGATARALGVAGCSIYRQKEPGEFMVAAEYGNTDGLDGLIASFADMEAGGAVTSAKVGSWQTMAAPTSYRQTVNGALAMWRHDDGEPWDNDYRLLINDVANQLGIANEQISNHERIVALSRTDSMTGLLNRRAFFEEELPRRLSRLSRNRMTAALFYVDMDNFKLVNDIHGHQRGDDAIMFLRDMLVHFSRPGDVIARLGGDEFAMWLDGITPGVTEKRAEALIEASTDMRQFSGDDDHPLGISVGVALYDPDANEMLDDMIGRADEAMYSVKNAGKGGFSVAPPPEPNDS